jgi:hypothetical protein
MVSASPTSSPRTLEGPAKWLHPARRGREDPLPWSRVPIFTGGSNLQSPGRGDVGASSPHPLINVLPIWEARLLPPTLG